MSTYLKNENAHGVRVGRTRIPPGGVAKVDGDEAKTYASYNGVEKASENDYNEYRQQDQVGGGSPSRDTHQRMKEYRHAHRAESVSAPLQVVVGDDDAPYGPATGTVTTKQLEAKKGTEEKRRFADHEQAEVPEGASEIEQRQAENTRAVEEVAQKLAQEQQAGGDGQEDENPQATQPQNQEQ